jgi:uncharacterized protein (DUF3820 family)
MPKREPFDGDLYLLDMYETFMRRAMAWSDYKVDLTRKLRAPGQYQGARVMDLPDPVLDVLYMSGAPEEDIEVLRTIQVEYTSRLLARLPRRAYQRKPAQPDAAAIPVLPNWVRTDRELRDMTRPAPAARPSAEAIASWLEVGIFKGLMRVRRARIAMQRQKLDALREG